MKLTEKPDKETAKITNA